MREGGQTGSEKGSQEGGSRRSRGAQTAARPVRQYPGQTQREIGTVHEKEQPDTDTMDK